MEINIGDNVEYIFPNSIGEENRSVFGKVEFISDVFVRIRTEQNVLLKVHFKNFSNLALVLGKNKNSVKEVI